MQRRVRATRTHTEPACARTPHIYTHTHTPKPSLTHTATTRASLSKQDTHLSQRERETERHANFPLLRAHIPKPPHRSLAGAFGSSHTHTHTARLASPVALPHPPPPSTRATHPSIHPGGRARAGLNGRMPGKGRGALCVEEGASREPAAARAEWLHEWRAGARAAEWAAEGGREAAG